MLASLAAVCEGMYQDVADLNTFYRSRLGQVTRRLLLARIRNRWTNVSGMRVIGLGYASPFLNVFRNEAERVLAFSPSLQGVIRWPEEGKCRICLTDEFALPLPDESMDRILLIHTLEHSEARTATMRELWRILTPSGRLVVVVAHRRGLWSKADHTPFGHGYPFNERQIDRLLKDCMFTPVVTERVIYVPPSDTGLSLWSAPAWERIGRTWGLPWPGLLLVEAMKQVHGVIPAARRFGVPQFVARPDHIRPARSTFDDASIWVASGAAPQRPPARQRGSPGLRSRS